MTQAIAEEVDTPLSEDDTAQYLKDIRRYPLLTPEQELEVAKGCARGDEEAIRTMVNSNLRLVDILPRNMWVRVCRCWI